MVIFLPVFEEVNLDLVSHHTVRVVNISTTVINKSSSLHICNWEDLLNGVD